MIHGDLYDYTKTVYNGANSKVLITCPAHGDYLQSASSHLSGYKCRKCGLDLQRKSSRMTLCDFVDRSNNKHQSKYDYSDVNWIKATIPVSISCPIHGDFMLNRMLIMLKGRAVVNVQNDRS